MSASRACVTSNTRRLASSYARSARRRTVFSTSARCVRALSRSDVALAFVSSVRSTSSRRSRTNRSDSRIDGNDDASSRKASSRDAHARNRSFVCALAAARHSPSSARVGFEDAVVVARASSTARIHERQTTASGRPRATSGRLPSVPVVENLISTRLRKINGNDDDDDDDDDDGTGARRGMKRTMTPPRATDPRGALRRRARARRYGECDAPRDFFRLCQCIATLLYFCLL